MDTHTQAKTKRKMSLGLISLLFLLPALLFYAIFELWPIIQTIWYSLYDWNGIDESTFVGLHNYKTVFTDPDLYGSILHSFYLIIFFSIIPIVLGLITAVLIKDMKSKGARGFAQVCLFLPRVIPGAAAGVAWTWMLADKGTVNQLLRAVGLGDFAHVWLGDQSTSLNAWASSASGCSSASAWCCCSPESEESINPCTRRQASMAPAGGVSCFTSPCPACADRSACALR